MLVHCTCKQFLSTLAGTLLNYPNTQTYIQIIDYTHCPSFLSRYSDVNQPTYLVCFPWATSDPVLLSLMSTEQNAKVFPTFRVSASITMSSPTLTGFINLNKKGEHVLFMHVYQILILINLGVFFYFQAHKYFLSNFLNILQNKCIYFCIMCR